MTSDTDPIVATAAGRLRGLCDGGLLAFRGVPYCEPPTGEARWAPPRRLRSWAGVRDARQPAPAPPQYPSRLAALMGPLPVAGYDEDCLTLNVWTPSADPQARLPVLVFIHGGGWKTGSGSAAWYDGSVMARRGGIVVVSVSYRLGSLGWMYLPRGVDGRPVANLGLLDQAEALTWVRENIAAFGGDPDTITLSGESAGAQSIVALQTTTAAGSFRRAIVDSASINYPHLHADEAAAFADLFLDAAGVPADDLEHLLRLPVSRVIEAEIETLVRWGRASGDSLLSAVMPGPFEPVIDGEVLAEDLQDACARGVMDTVELMVAHTADESRAFLAFDDELWNQDEAALAAQITPFLDVDWPALLADYVRLDPSAPAADALCRLVDDEMALAQLLLAQRSATVGKGGYVLWFAWPSPAADGRLGAAHTVDLPFVFKNFDAWPDSPMLAGVPRDELETVATHVQDAWIAFAKTGSPGWPAFGPPDHTAMQIGRRRELVKDLRGDRLRLQRSRGRMHPFDEVRAAPRRRRPVTS